MKDSILIADDEPKIVEVLSDYLTKAGYNPLMAYTGKEAVNLVESALPRLVILDLMLPDLNGEEVCKIIRAKSSIPILMLSAKHTEQERIKGLELGADDYVTKPFSAKEVVTRVGTILRRSQEHRPLASHLSYGNGDLVIDANTQSVLKQSTDAQLTLTEFRLLSSLARHPKRAFTREELIVRTFGMDFRGDDRTIDAHIKNIRAKVEDDPRNPTYIETVYGHGYRFNGGEQQ